MRTREAKQRRNKKNRERWRRKRAEARTLAWFPGDPMDARVDAELLDYQAAQRELLEEIGDDDDPRGDP